MLYYRPFPFLRVVHDGRKKYGQAQENEEGGVFGETVTIISEFFCHLHTTCGATRCLIVDL